MCVRAALKLLHHHHVHEGLGVFPVPSATVCSWSLHLPTVVLRSFVPLVYIVVLVLVDYLCPSSVRVVATFSGTVLFPLLCSVLPFFPQYIIDSFLYLVLLFQVSQKFHPCCF